MNHFPIDLNSAITFSDKIPSEVDVVVIGGGVIGVFSALFINRLGLKVVLLEKGRVGGEQSSRNWGWIRQQGRDEDEIPIMQDASRLWEQIDQQVDGKTGFRRHGMMYIASSEEKLKQRQKWLSTASDFGIDSHSLDRAQMAKVFNTSEANLYASWLGAVYTPSDARAEPWRAVSEVAKLAHQEGVMIVENCAVRTLHQNNRELAAVHTEKGLIKTSQAIVAAGAWSSLFLRNHGIKIPQLSVRASVVQTAPLAEIWQGNAADEKLAFRRRNDGGYTLALPDFIELFMGPDTYRHSKLWYPAAKKNWRELRLNPCTFKNFPDSFSVDRKWQADEVSPFEKIRVLNPKAPTIAAKRIQARFAERFLHRQSVPILKSWAGMIDAMPDMVPIVDYAPSTKGLLVATGMSGHGFGIAPGFAKIISQLVTQTKLSHDIQRFRFSRFTDGSTLKLGPTI